MNTELKSKIEIAVQKVFNDWCNSRDGVWDMYIHDNLVRQMTDAAEVVFDASQDAQKYFELETQ